MATIYGSNSVDDISTDDLGNQIFGWSEANLAGDEGPIDDDDSLSGGEGADTIQGGAGRDQLYGEGGGDILFGGSQADKIFGNLGNDTLYGGMGGDVLGGQKGVNQIYGGDGDDQLTNQSAMDSIYGGVGVDRLVFYRGSVVLDLVVDISATDPFVMSDGTHFEGIELLTFFGGRGDDHVTGGGLNDYLSGRGGDDTLLGLAGNDVLVGGRGDNLIDGGLGNDRVSMNSVKTETRVMGGDGVDRLELSYLQGAQTFRFHANDGAPHQIGELTYSDFERLYFVGYRNFDDDVSGGARRDTLGGGGGSDRLAGCGGTDFLTGGVGNDRLFGGHGRDVLSGGAGADIQFGGIGADVLLASAGRDTLIGGGGADEFQLTRFKNGEAQHIRDFGDGFDQLTLHLSYFKGQRGIDDYLSFNAFVLGTKAQDASDRVIYDQKTGKLYFDRDGSGADQQVLIAILDNKADLAAGDIMIRDFAF